MSKVPVLTSDDAVSRPPNSVRDSPGVPPTGTATESCREQIAELAASGLLAVTVPAEFGGAGLPAATVADVFRLIACGDPNIAQIPHNHFVFVNQLLAQGTRDQHRPPG